MASAFRPISQASTDARRRISLDEAGAAKDARYVVSINDDGEILLTPIASISERERAIWENDAVRGQLVEAMERAAVGDTVDLGDFSQYLEED